MRSLFLQLFLTPIQTFMVHLCFLREQYISNITIKMKTIDQIVEEGASPPHKMPKSTGSLFSFLPQAASRKRHALGSINELDIYLTEADEDPKCDIMKYWNLNSNKCPTLGKLIKHTLHFLLLQLL